MSTLTKAPSTDRVILYNVTWETYEALLKNFENQSSPRLAYDQGVLEIMSPHLEHDSAKEILAYIVIIALEEQDIDFVATGSTTFKREVLKRGFEPDASFYIKNAARLRAKKRLDLEIDPSPELIIEIDVMNDSMDKFPLYAALGVAEVWRYEDAVAIWCLDHTKYSRSSVSRVIPILNEKRISEFMQTSLSMKRPEWARDTRNRIAELLK